MNLSVQTRQDKKENLDLQVNPREAKARSFVHFIWVLIISVLVFKKTVASLWGFYSGFDYSCDMVGVGAISANNSGTQAGTFQ